MNTKPVIIIVIIAVVAAAAISTYMTSEPEPAMTTSSELSGVVNLGMLFALTGDMSSYGEESHAAALLAVDDFNAYLAEKDSKWSINGIVEDSQTNPVIALEKVEAIHSRDAKVIVGPGTSANLRNIMGYTDANGMVLISYSSTAPALAIPDDHIFRTVPDDNSQAPAITALLKSRGIDVLVPVWRGDTWGDGLKESTERSFTESGGIVTDGIRYNPDTPEFSASTSLLSEQVREYTEQYGEDKVGVLLISFAEALPFMQSSSENDILVNVKWFGCDGNSNLQNMVEDPIGLEFINETDFTAVQFSTADNSINKRVSEQVAASLGRTPTVYAHSAYDAVWLAGLAIESAQGTNAKDIKASIPVVAQDYTGAVGPIKLNDAGDLVSLGYAIWAVRDGQWTIIGNSADFDTS